MSDAAETGRGVGQRIMSLSRPAKFLIVLGAVLVVLAATGVMRADRGVEISSDEAAEIALPFVDFEPEQTTVRLVRQGIDLEPIWAVSFSIQKEDEDGFERLTVVRVHGESGEVLEVIQDE